MLDDILRRGAHLFEQPLDASAASALLADLRSERRYDESLFLSEAEFDADPQYRGVIPRPGRNLLENHADKLATGHPADAPLHVLENSHALGAAVFPHDLTKQAGGWRYRNGDIGQVLAPQRVLTGDAGFCALWHACTLHGAQPDAADREHISLRYLFGPKAGSRGGIHPVNEAQGVPLRLGDTRVDLDARGQRRSNPMR